MHKLSIALLAMAAGLSGCVVYDEPAYRDSGARYGYHDRGSYDRDRDGIPNRSDRDRDGDGVRNSRDSRPDNPYRY
jgi:hypothetical protein